MSPRANRSHVPRRYHHGDLASALIDAGGALIERGEPLTVRAVAALAGVSAAAPYRHFEDLEALQAAILTRGFQALTARTEAARAAQRNPVDGYLAVGHAYVGFAQAQPRLFRMMFGPDCNKPQFPALIEAGQQAFAVVRRAAQACKDAGLLGDADAGEVAVAGWSMVHGLASLHADGTLDLVHPQPFDAVVPAMFRILLLGVVPRQEAVAASPVQARKSPRKRA